jgi:hypothetical protein
MPLIYIAGKVSGDVRPRFEDYFKVSTLPPSTSHTPQHLVKILQGLYLLWLECVPCLVNGNRV